MGSDDQDSKNDKAISQFPLAGESSEGSDKHRTTVTMSNKDKQSSEDSHRIEGGLNKCMLFSWILIFKL